MHGMGKCTIYIDIYNISIYIVRGRLLNIYIIFKAAPPQLGFI